MPELDVTTDAEQISNLVDVNMWLQTCNSAVYYIGMLYLLTDISVSDIIGYDRIIFS